MISSYSSSKEVRKAIEDGYSIRFDFLDGSLCCEINGKLSYSIKDVHKTPTVDLEHNILVYRLLTHDGIRGYAIAEWDDEF